MVREDDPPGIIKNPFAEMLEGVLRGLSQKWKMIH
jgi:hypothetical protein